MWWFLKKFGEQITLHTLLQPKEKMSVGQVITSTSDFFIDGTDEWPGLARRSVKRFSKILWWRKKENLEKLKKRIEKYNQIFMSCFKEEYIECKEWKKEGDRLIALKPTRGKIYDESRGWAGLIQVVGKNFSMTWIFTGWIVSLVIAILAYIFK